MTNKSGVILAIIGYIVFFFCMEGWGGLEFQLLHNRGGIISLMSKGLPVNKMGWPCMDQMSI